MVTGSARSGADCKSRLTLTSPFPKIIDQRNPNTDAGNLVVCRCAMMVTILIMAAR